MHPFLLLLLLIFVRPGPRPGIGPDSLPFATVQLDREEQRLVIELPPVDLPAAGRGQGEAMVGLPLCQLHVPVSASLHSARVEVLDGSGRALPHTLLHHFNLSDPDHRELFLPIGLHVLAASRETPTITVPRFLFGLPLKRGQRLIAGAMLANTSAEAYHGVRVRLVLRYVPGGRPWPLYRAYPWAIDVQYPLGRPPNGSKAFDLPPGRTERFWEGSPAIAGTILGLGGHLHDFGVSLELKDVTSGQVLWQGTPVTDGTGRIISFPLARFYNWHRLGVHVAPEHRYRLTAVYDNHTGHAIRDGGMGAVAGLFVPDRGTTWPAVDIRDTLYQQDLAATIRSGSTDMMADMMMNHHADP
ncbi:MAG TPA: hypothetical protein VM716_01770 [Gemmatimonadales bacterium]|nr:hypothetical protein [Gemmatimonadales bacterium]